MGERDLGEQVGERVGDKHLESLYMHYIGTKSIVSGPGTQTGRSAKVQDRGYPNWRYPDQEYPTQILVPRLGVPRLVFIS